MANIKPRTDIKSVEHTTASDSFNAFYLRDPKSDHLDQHFNDGECGAVGTLWATTKNMYEKEKRAALYCFPANLRSETIGEDCPYRMKLFAVLLKQTVCNLNTVKRTAIPFDNVLAEEPINTERPDDMAIETEGAWLIEMRDG